MKHLGHLGILSLVLGVSACAIDARKLADQELSRAVGAANQGHATLLAFTAVDGSTRVDTAVVSRGAIQRKGEPVTLIDRETSWGRILITSPSEDRPAVEKALDIGSDAMERWLAGTVASLENVLELVEVSRFTSLHLKVVAVPPDTAFEYQASTVVGRDALEVALLISVDPDSGSPAAQWYSDLVAVAAHEMVHLSYVLADKKPPNRFNEETAASIVGMCGRVLFARAIDARVTVGLSLRNSHLYTAPGDPPRFSPDRGHVERGSPTFEGSNMALAFLISQFGAEFASDDDEVDRTLLPICARLGGGSVPDFISGAAF